MTLLYADAPGEFRDPTALVVRLPRGIRSRQKLFAILADRLRFPSYFGWNWDALEECLRDLSWLPADWQRVALVHEDLPFGSHSEHRATYLSILAELPDKVVAVVPAADRSVS